jgi:small subunit ribosomal protein S13
MRSRALQDGGNASWLLKIISTSPFYVFHLFWNTAVTMVLITSTVSRNLSDNTQVLIFGSNFAESRLVSRALQTFYGVGPQISTKLMARFSIHKTAKVGMLNDGQINGIVAELSSMTLENDLRRQLVENIRRLRDMGAYRGRRHAMNLPVRGQRTRSQVSCLREAVGCTVWLGRILTTCRFKQRGS